MLRKGLIPLLAALLAVLPLLGVGPDRASAASARIAAIKELSGEVVVRKDGGSAELGAVVGMSLSQGDMLVTGDDGSAALVFSNGTTEDDSIAAGPNTSLVLSKLSDDSGTITKVSVTSGTVWSDVRSIRNADDQFLIETPVSAMSARGTNFMTSIDPLSGLAETTVFAGIVHLTEKGGNAPISGSGQAPPSGGGQTQVTGGGQMPTPGGGVISGSGQIPTGSGTVPGGSGPIFGSAQIDLYPTNQILLGGGVNINQIENQVGIIDLDRFASAAPPSILNAIFNSADKIEQENEILVNSLKPQQKLPEVLGTNFSNFEHNIDVFLNAIVQTVNRRDPGLATELLNSLNGDPADISKSDSFQLTEEQLEKQKELAERLQQAQEQKKAQRDIKQQSLENQLNQLTMFLQELNAKNQASLDAEKKQALTEYMSQLTREELMRFQAGLDQDAGKTGTPPNTTPTEPSGPPVETNHAPTDLSVSQTEFDHALAAGDAVGTLSASDPDSGDTFSFSLKDGEGSVDNAKFAIEGSSLKAAAPLGEGTYSILVEVTDAGGLTFDKALTIKVTVESTEPTDPTEPEETNHAPTNLALSQTELDHVLAAGDTVGMLSATDPDDGDTFAYSLKDGEGGENNASFAIEGSSLKAAAALGEGTYSILVEVRDAGGLTFEKAIMISVSVNHEPTAITLTLADDIGVGVEANTIVGSLSATDSDEGDTLSFSLVAGEGDDNNSLFTVEGDNLVAAADLGAGAYSVLVRVTDAGGLYYDQSVTIKLLPPGVEQWSTEVDGVAVNWSFNGVTPGEGDIPELNYALYLDSAPSVMRVTYQFGDGVADEPALDAFGGEGHLTIGEESFFEVPGYALHIGANDAYVDYTYEGQMYSIHLTVYGKPELEVDGSYVELDNGDAPNTNILPAGNGSFSLFAPVTSDVVYPLAMNLYWGADGGDVKTSAGLLLSGDDGANIDLNAGWNELPIEIYYEGTNKLAYQATLNVYVGVAIPEGLYQTGFTASKAADGSGSIVEFAPYPDEPLADIPTLMQGVATPFDELYLPQELGDGAQIVNVLLYDDDDSTYIPATVVDDGTKFIIPNTYEEIIVVVESGGKQLAYHLSIE